MKSNFSTTGPFGLKRFIFNRLLISPRWLNDFKSQKAFLDVDDTRLKVDKLQMLSFDKDFP
jgi:hypothetical protein